MPMGGWKQKYFKQYSTLQRNIRIATERGYSVPSEITSIPKARGGYKQAYERIHKLTLPTIQRQSTFTLPDPESPTGSVTVMGGRAMSVVRKMRGQGYTQTEAYSSIRSYAQELRNNILSSRGTASHYGQVEEYDYESPEPSQPLTRLEQLEADTQAWEGSKLRAELEQLYRDTYEGATGEKPDYVPYIPMTANAETILSMLDSTIGNGGVKSSSSEGEDTIYRAIDLINQFPNRELKYRAHKALQNARAENPSGLASKLSSQSSEATSILQEGVQITYSGESVEQDDRASMWLSDWVDFLEDADEYEYEDEDM